MRTLVITLALALCAPALVAQADDGDKKKEDGAVGLAQITDEQAVEAIKDLQAKMKDLPEDDARKSAKSLIMYWNSDAVTEGTKKQIPKMLADMAKDKRIKVAMAGIEGFGGLDPKTGGKLCMSVLKKESKAKEPAVDIYGPAFDSLKKLADTSKGTVGDLIKYLRHKNDAIAAKAAYAMSGYEKSTGPVRREMVEELIKNTEGLYQQADQAPRSPQTRRWNVMKSPVLRALKALTGGQPFRNPSEARTWFNDNKKDKKLWKKT